MSGAVTDLLPDPLVAILAGGAGTRMGGAKFIRELAGRRLLDHALDIASRWSSDPLVVVAAAEGQAVSGLRAVVDRQGIAGPLGGIAAALDQALGTAADRLMILPVDMPFLPEDLLPQLAAALDREPAAGCAIASAGGDRYPVCSLWRVERLAEALPGYAGSGERSLRGLVERLGGVAVEWSGTAACSAFFNINTAADLAAAERWLERGIDLAGTPG